MKVSLASLFGSKDADQGFTVEVDTAEKTDEKPVRLCDKCGREFSEALLATNYSAEPAETYYACPYCLSRVNIETAEALSEEEQEDLTQVEKIEPIEPAETVEPPKETAELKVAEEAVEEIKEEAEEKKAGPAGPTGCPYYLGYLKEKGKDKPIPEKCLTCPKMLECLL